MTTQTTNYTDYSDEQLQREIDRAIRTSANLTSKDREDMLDYVLELQNELSRRQVTHLRKTG